MDYLPPPPHVTSTAQQEVRSYGHIPANRFQESNDARQRSSKDLAHIKILSRSDAGKDKATEGSAKQIESIFIKQMMGSMRSAGKPFKSGLFGSSSEDIYQDMLEQSMSDELSTKGFGLGDQIVPQLRMNMGLSPTNEGAFSGSKHLNFKMRKGIPVPAKVDLNKLDTSSQVQPPARGADQEQQAALENVLHKIKSENTHTKHEDPFVLDQSSLTEVEMHAPLEQIIQKHTFKSSENVR